uniref:Uncharacterized protein n=1 Tax=Anguilla anguilla TaxID=7936 RepID=A0A0E9QSZ4_ANGAN
MSVLISQWGSPKSDEMWILIPLKPPIPWATQAPIVHCPVELPATVVPGMVRIQPMTVRPIHAPQPGA